MELDPDKREWEYDGTGSKIYKLEAGKSTKTPWIAQSNAATLRMNDTTHTGGQNGKQPLSNPL